MRIGFRQTDNRKEPFWIHRTLKCPRWGKPWQIQGADRRQRLAGIVVVGKWRVGRDESRHRPGGSAEPFVLHADLQNHPQVSGRCGYPGVTCALVALFNSYSVKRLKENGLS